jgi:hypothetical protein
MEIEIQLFSMLRAQKERGVIELESYGRRMGVRWKMK